MEQGLAHRAGGRMQGNMDQMAKEDEMGAQQPEEQQVAELIKQIIMLLRQGVSPEDLIKEGVPRELVEAALQELRNEMPEEGSNEISQGLAANAAL